jgi:glucose/arabinose dehydrogenase
LGSAGNHNGGGISFGTDGKLYISTGENTISSNAQSTSSLLGKIHRINKDGTIPTDNPMYNTLTGKLIIIRINQPVTPSIGNYRAIYAMGVRNPWTLHGASSGEVLFFDVGAGTYEEVNVATAGANYGWPTYEGYTASPSLENYQNPIYSFGRGADSSSGD